MASEIKWIKISTGLPDNRKIKQIRKLPDGDTVALMWVFLICLAGETNEDGMIYFTPEIPYTEEMLADQFDMDLNTVRMGLATFQKFGMIEIIDDIICLPSWEKWQAVDGMAVIREQTRKRVAKHREKQRLAACNVTGNVTVTQSNATEIEEDKDKKEKKKEKKQEETKDFSDDPDLNKAILAFMEFRKSIKKPMTDHAVSLLLNKLNGMTTYIPEQIEIINQSIVNGWQGVFPLKNEQVQAVRQTYQKQTKADELEGFYNMAKEWAET